MTKGNVAEMSKTADTRKQIAGSESEHVCWIIWNGSTEILLAEIPQ